MASMVLYPPIIDSYMPAFKATPKDSPTETPCRIYFSLSNFNAISDVATVQVSIRYQDSNLDAAYKRDIDPNSGDPISPEDDPTGHYRQTGIILNIIPHRVENESNLFYFDLYNIDINGHRDESNNNNSTSSYIGWVPNKIYKLQMRLSSIAYEVDPTGEMTQQRWLNDQTNNTCFSEWSTICILKAIGPVDIIIPILEFDTNKDDPAYSQKTLFLSTFDLNGTFVYNHDASDQSERLYSFRVRIYEGGDSGEFVPILEDSGILYTNQYVNQNEFKYLAKIEAEQDKTYTIVIDFVTNNEYTLSTKIVTTISHFVDTDFDCVVNYLYSDINNNKDNGKIEAMFDGISTLDEEEEEGRICLKITANENSSVPCYGNFYIRRASSKDGFVAWEDIYLITLKGEPIDGLDPIYDYSIESGVFYMYGIQPVDSLGFRSVLCKNEKPTMRNFNFSYLLGQNNQQLKLMFDNTMNSYKIQVSETKSETIGHRFPKVVRNNAVYYKIFPINGLISYLMDINNLFCEDKDLYSNVSKYGNIPDLYKEYNKAPKALAVDADYNGLIETGGSRTLIDYNSGLPILDDEGKPILVTPSVDYIFDRDVTLRDNLGDYPANYGPSSDEKLNGKHFPQYDYIHEKDFREAVLNFLYDGQPKLFKSPTEGNVIVRLMDINCTPVQPLNRMLYSFTSNGNEIAENTVDNYRKYKFVDVPEKIRDLSSQSTKIGQIHLTFDTYLDSGEEVLGTDIIERIYDKHNRMNDNYGGYQTDLIKIHHLRITVDQKPFRIRLNESPYNYIYTLGNQFRWIKDNPEEAAEASRDFTIYNTMQMFEFDERNTFTKDDHIYFLPDADNLEDDKQTKVIATIDYLYDVKEQTYQGRQMTSRSFKSVLGQFFEQCDPSVNTNAGYSIYNAIKEKYNIQWGDSFRELNTISSAEIYAIPNSVFVIQDSGDKIKTNSARTHVINESGILNLHNIQTIKDIRYMGWYDKQFNLHTSPREIPSTTIMVNYHATIKTGTYKED